MSSFGAKLERVHFPKTSALPPRIDSMLDDDPLPLDPRRRLDALRDRIAAILAKSSVETTASPAPTPHADPSLGDLPFAREETASGPIYVRTKRLSPAHRVGRAPVHVGRDASREMLALLALDPLLVSCDPGRAVYIDTETTGLSGGAGTVPFLIGLAWFEEGGSLVVEQLLLRELGEETPMLERFVERVARACADRAEVIDAEFRPARLVLDRGRRNIGLNA